MSSAPIELIEPGGTVVFAGRSRPAAGGAPGPPGPPGPAANLADVLAAGHDADGGEITNLLLLATQAGASISGTVVTVTQLEVVDDFEEATAECRLFVGTASPTAGGGLAAPLASLYSRTNGAAGELWVKTGAANNAWTKLTP